MKKIKRTLYLKFARKINSNNLNTPVPSIVSEHTTVKGDLLSKNIIHVDGKVEGDITCEELVIGIKGSVSGSVTAKQLQLYGSLKGKAFVDDLFVAKSAKLIGDATHNTIAIEPGAYIDGHCVRSSSAIPAEQAKPDLMITDKSKKSK